MNYPLQNILWVVYMMALMAYRLRACFICTVLPLSHFRPIGNFRIFRIYNTCSLQESNRRWVFSRNYPLAGPRVFRWADVISVLETPGVSQCSLDNPPSYRERRPSTGSRPYLHPCTKWVVLSSRSLPSNLVVVS